MSKKLIIVTILIGVFAMGAAVVSAQGNGNRGGAGGNGTRGGGRGTQIQQNLRTPTNPDCNYDATGVMGSQMNATGNNTAGSAGMGNQNGQMNGGSGMYGTAGMNGTGLYANLPPATEGDLPQAVVDLMTDGWLDEQHAYAVYDAIIAQFGNVAPFVNIQQAELQHAAAWELMFDRYGIAVPAVPSFDVPTFATLQDACAAAAAA